MSLAPVPSLSCSTLAEDVFKEFKTCQSTSLVRGTVACMKVTGTDADVVDPDNANAGPVVGLVMSGGPLTSGAYGAPALNDPLTIQRFGRAVGLLTTSQTITKGDPLGTASGDTGKLRLYRPGQGMRFIGIAAQSKTTTSTALFIDVDLNCNPRAVAAMPIFGSASTNSQNNTRYLSAPGTTTPASSPVVLFVVPPGGGYIRNLVASSTTAPGGSDSDVYAAYINAYSAGAYGGFGSASALTCTISAGAFEAKDSTHAVAVNEGDLIAIGVVASATSLGAGRSATLQFTQQL